MLQQCCWVDLWICSLKSTSRIQTVALWTTANALAVKHKNNWKICQIAKTIFCETRSGEYVKISRNSLQAWMVARVAMTLSSVSPSWPLKVTPWNPRHICYHSSTIKRKVLYREDHTPKPFFDELKYFQEAQKRVKVLHEKLQEASNKLATTLINLKRKFPSRIGKDRQSRTIERWKT